MSHSRRWLLRGGLALAGIGLLAGCDSVPGRVLALAKLGILLFSTPTADPNLHALLEGLHELGYREGQNVAIEYRYAEGVPERLPGLAADLAKLKPDLIVALGGDVAPAAKQATTSIPIVMATSADPVLGGLVASLAHPGANVTGVTFLSSELAGKRLEFLANIRPSISRAAVLWNPEHADADFQNTRAAAEALGLGLQSQEVRRAEDLDAAFEALARGGAEGLIVVPSRLTSLHVQAIAAFALAHHLPLVSGWARFARVGGLLTYGPNLDDAVRRAAAYADKILKGTKPADLPVEQPTTFELVINLKTAQALGMTIPPSLLQQATEVIR